MAKDPRLWRCPKCGHRFPGRNLSHSCGNYRLADHFENRSAFVRQLFDRWRAMAKACGPVTIYAQKTRIVFQARVRFAGAIVHKDWLEATVWLKEPAEHRCVHRVEVLGQLGYNVHLRLRELSDLDVKLEGLVRRAYRDHRAAVTRSDTATTRRD